MALSVTPAILVPTAPLAATAAAIYTSPGGGNGTVVKKSTFTNQTGGAITFNVWRVASGGTNTNDNLVISALSVAAGATYIANELNNLVLEKNDALYADASAASSINATISGFTF